MHKLLDKNRIDVAQAFLVYMACIGDVEKVAIALDLEPSQVEQLAEAEGWRDKIRRVSIMSKSGRPGDFERAQNRALCFVQAQCIRQQLDRLLMECAGMTNEELLAKSCVRTRDGGSQLSAKFLLDMASAAEACHRMSYAALNDTVSERADRETDSRDNSSNDLHSAIIAALSNPSTTPPSTTLLLQEANEKVSDYSSAEVSDHSPERGSSG
jgi:hypothetical protein